MTDNVDVNDDQTYEISIRILSNEIFGVRLSTTSTSNKWLVISLVTIFSFITLLGAYGDKLSSLYNSIAG